MGPSLSMDHLNHLNHQKAGCRGQALPPPQARGGLQNDAVLGADAVCCMTET